MDAARHTDEALITAYRAVAAGDMSTLPGFNPRLRLEAVGFRSWEGHRIGVLIAPWFMNLVLLPGPRDDWSRLAGQESSEWKLPAGPYQFNPCELPGVGLHLTAPLFTDLTGFPDQATARAVGVEVMRRLFEPDGADATPALAEDGGEILARPISRRGLFGLVAEPENDA